MEGRGKNPIFIHSHPDQAQQKEKPDPDPPLIQTEEKIFIYMVPILYIFH